MQITVTRKKFIKINNIKNKQLTDLKPIKNIDIIDRNATIESQFIIKRD